MIKKMVYLVAAVAMLCSCQTPSFRVKGVINDAETSASVYLEQLSLGKTIVVDSCQLDKKYAFSLKASRPQYPDLYRLRVAGKHIILAVDSLEQIELQASLQNMLNAQFTGSEKSQQIARLRLSLRENDLADHKQFAREMILQDPGSAVAYYALFQTKNGEPVFDLSVKEDRVFYQAVATSWNTWMPENPRTKMLYSQVLGQMNAERKSLNAAIVQAFIDEQENAFLDIVLQNEYHEDQALSDYKGKVILLDFCSQEIDSYKDYLFSLRERYNKYHTKGLEIYQVYPDQNRLVWEDQVAALPWATVRTENGLIDPVYTRYNVTAIPTIFLIDRKGEIQGRFVGFSAIDEAIEKLL